MGLHLLGGLSSNDTVGIRVPGGAGTSWEFSNLPGGATRTLTFDLSALPGGQTGGQSTSSIMSSLNAIRRLEVSVQDDTSVDYIELKLEFCECSPNGTPSGSPST